MALRQPVRLPEGDVRDERLAELFQTGGRLVKHGDDGFSLGKRESHGLVAGGVGIEDEPGGFVLARVDEPVGEVNDELLADFDVGELHTTSIGRAVR